MTGFTLRQRMAALVLLILLGIGGLLLFVNDSRPKGVEFVVAARLQPVYVHVCGAVLKPGVIRLKPGARVYEALQKAGGSLQDADLTQVNLAKLVEDGEQIYLPRKGEIIRTGNIAARKKGGRKADVKPKLTGPLNLNLASQIQLESLPGIGPALAERIVTYRKEHGLFRSYEELDNVNGIGKSMLEKLRAFLYVK
jgi:competence protein ComEA